MSVHTREQHLTRVFSTGALAFQVATSSADDRALIEGLFQDLPPGPESVHLVEFSLVRANSNDDAWVLSSPANLPEEPLPLAIALARLLGSINLAALDSEPDYLHLHAAAAARDGRAVLIAAERNTGKTTTVVNLVARGWGFVTDETVRVAADDNVVSGFPKPVSIKPGGMRRVPHLAPAAVPPLDGDLDAGSFEFASISACGGSVVEGAVPHLLVLLRRSPDGRVPDQAAAVALHPADAVVALMQETLDAERFGATTLRLARLASESHCYQISLGSVGSTVEQIEALMELPPVQPMDVHPLPPSDAMAPGVTTVEVGDRVVVHDDTTGRILALDAAGAAIWKHLGGWQIAGAVDIAGPVVRQFVAELRQLGVLAADR